MSRLTTKITHWHNQFFGLASYLQSPYLLFVRLDGGRQLAESGWGKVHHLARVTEYFASLGSPMPGRMAAFSN